MKFIRQNSKALVSIIGATISAITAFGAGNPYAGLGVAILSGIATWLVSNESGGNPSNGK